MNPPICVATVIVIALSLVLRGLLTVIIELLIWIPFNLCNAGSGPRFGVDIVKRSGSFWLGSKAIELSYIASSWPMSKLFSWWTSWVGNNNLRTRLLEYCWSLGTLHILKRLVAVDIAWRKIVAPSWIYSLSIIGILITLRRNIGLIAINWSSWQNPRVSELDIADIVVPAFRAVRVVVNKGRVDGFVLGVSFYVDTLVSEDHSALALGSLEVDILRIMDDLFFNGYILISLHFLFHLHHLYFFLGNHFFLVLNSLFNGVVIGFNDLFGDGFSDSPLLQSGFFLFYWHFFHVLTIFVLNNFFFIGDVVDSTLSWGKWGLPLTTSSFLTWDATKLFDSVLTLDPELTTWPVLEA